MLKAIIGSSFLLVMMSLAQQDTTPLKDKELYIEIVNRDTHKQLENATVYLYEMPSKQLVATQTTVDGHTVFPIDFGQAYEIRACRRVDMVQLN